MAITAVAIVDTEEEVIRDRDMDIMLLDTDTVMALTGGTGAGILVTVDLITDTIIMNTIITTTSIVTSTDMDMVDMDTVDTVMVDMAVTADMANTRI
jgi:hypothetical protein